MQDVSLLNQYRLVERIEPDAHSVFYRLAKRRKQALEEKWQSQLADAKRRGRRQGQRCARDASTDD